MAYVQRNGLLVPKRKIDVDHPIHRPRRRLPDNRTPWVWAPRVIPATMAVALDAQSATWKTATAVSPMSVTTLTTTAVANAILVFVQSGAAATFPTGLTVKWDIAGANQSFTQVSGTFIGSASTTCCGAIYALLAPASFGNKTITIAWTSGASIELHAQAISFTGVDQTSIAVAFPHGNTATGTSVTSSVTITSATGNMVVAGHNQNVANFTGTNNTIIGTFDNTGLNIGVVANRAAGAASVAMTASISSSGLWNSFGCDILAAAAGTVSVVEQSFFDTVRLKRPANDFAQGPFAGISPPLSGTFATSAFFDTVKLKQPIISVPDVTPPQPPRLAGEKWFEPPRLKPPIIDNPPILLTVATATANVVEQPFFEQVRLKRPVEYGQGPFAGTSPPLTIPYLTQAFFDQVRLRQPVIDAPSPLFSTQVVVVNFSASNWFDAVKLFKVPERFGELYPQQFWTPQSYGAWFEQIKLQKVPERLQEQFGTPFPPPILETSAFFEAVRLKRPTPGFDFITATVQPNTVQNALTDWFATTKLKQPIIDQPIVVYFPAQVAPTFTAEYEVMFFANVGKLMGH